MVLRRCWRNFRVTKWVVFYEKYQFPNGFWFWAIISFFAYISWNNGFTAILTKFSCHQRVRYFMRRIKFQMVFYWALISFSAHISWNNGFTAILTKFSCHQRRRYFMRRINSQMVFDFGSQFRFLHISREIMVLRRFWRNFRVTKGVVFYEKYQFPNGFLFRALISFSAHISWNNGFTAILTKFSGHQMAGILREVSIPKWFLILGHNLVFCIYLVK